MDNHQQKSPGGKAPPDNRGERRASKITQTDLAQDIMGNNQLQGNDQLSVDHSRRAVPDVKQDTDGLIESFEKLDKDVRARTDLGKGNRSSKA
jgi:hypothetical protein